MVQQLIKDHEAGRLASAKIGTDLIKHMATLVPDKYIHTDRANRGVGVGPRSAMELFVELEDALKVAKK